MIDENLVQELSGSNSKLRGLSIVPRIDHQHRTVPVTCLCSFSLSPLRIAPQNKLSTLLESKRPLLLLNTHARAHTLSLLFLESLASLRSWVAHPVMEAPPSASLRPRYTSIPFRSTLSPNLNSGFLCGIFFFFFFYDFSATFSRSKE